MNTKSVAQIDSTDNFAHADVDRFVAKVQLPAEINDRDACWLWTGARHSKNRGYGKFKLAGRCMNAHKASHLLFNGEVGEGLVVGHQCNNEQCVNPYHLVAQTQSDNIKYAIICGRLKSRAA